jgi:Ran GTPase-activating protein (RanGAP) involved in mRNA processing and transport
MDALASVHIHSTDSVADDTGTNFTVFVIAVETRSKAKWEVRKRYSEFETLYLKVQGTCANLNSPFPQKEFSFFGISAVTLELRMSKLDAIVKEMVTAANGEGGQKSSALRRHVHNFLGADEHQGSTNYSLSEAMIAQLVKELESDNPSLLKLSLEPNAANEKGMHRIVKACSTNTTLTSLNLSGNYMCVDTIKLLASYLGKSDRLSQLALGSSSLDFNTAGLLFDALSSNENSALQSLFLRQNKLGPHVVDALSNLLSMRCLLTVDLWGNDLGVNVAHNLANLLGKNLCHVQGFGLRDNCLGPEGSGILAEALRSNQSLTSFDLRENNLTAEGVGPLAESLKTNTSITALDLGGNSLGPCGGAIMADMIAQNKSGSLRFLRLWGNGLGAEGASLLSHALAASPSSPSSAHLTALDLRQNSLGDEGVEMLCDSLVENKHLIVLLLNKNKISPTGAAAIFDLLHTNR